MGVNLQKGQKVDLTKGSSGLKILTVGLGWDEVQPQKKRFFGSSKPLDFDCDASALLLSNDRLMNNDDIVCFTNLTHNSGAVVHKGDNLTGAGDGDCEQIAVELDKVPPFYNKIVFVVNIFMAVERKQHIGMLQNAYIRIVNAQNNQEICKYLLSDNYNGMTALIFGEVFKNGSEWEFSAIGEATRDFTLTDLVKRYS